MWDFYLGEIVMAASFQLDSIALPTHSLEIWSERWEIWSKQLRNMIGEIWKYDHRDEKYIWTPVSEIGLEIWWKYDQRNEKYNLKTSISIRRQDPNHYYSDAGPDPTESSEENQDFILDSLSNCWWWHQCMYINGLAQDFSLFCRHPSKFCVF